MKDIELVIKIPKRVYNYTHKHHHIANSDVLDIKDAIINGVPLPKGHGNLIDADELTESTLCKTFGLRSVDIENAPTIVEADKEVQNDETDM